VIPKKTIPQGYGLTMGPSGMVPAGHERRKWKGSRHLTQGVGGHEASLVGAYSVPARRGAGLASARLGRLTHLTPGFRPGTDQWLELLFRGSVVLLAGVTLTLAALPVIHGHFAAPAIDLALDTLAVVVSGAVAVLAWTRFGERRASIALFQSAAFLCLTIAYGAAVVISLGRDADPVTLSNPNPMQTYYFALARAMAASILVLAGTAAGIRLAVQRPSLLLLGPGMLLLAVIALASIHAWAPQQSAWLATVDPDGSGLPAANLFGTIVQVCISLLFFQAAIVCRDRWRRDRAIGDGWMAVGLVFAAFAEIHWILYPVGHPGQVSTADLLRLAFFAALLLAIEAEARSAMSRLRTANAELARLRDSEVERAGLEERARLARELHDGLAQDLWLAKLKAGQLSALPDLPEAAVSLVEDAEAAIENGLAEARQAVMALRMSPERELDLAEFLRRYVDDFEDRFGLRVEFTSSVDDSEVAARTQAEVLRIAQEALVNVRQHAEASVVGVRLEIEDGRLTLRVVDNGHGFDTDTAKDSSFGLASMRERAAIIGGRLSVESTPGDGTRVCLIAPATAPSRLSATSIR
jgi:signal transduction histidine kinase